MTSHSVAFKTIGDNLFSTSLTTNVEDCDCQGRQRHLLVCTADHQVNFDGQLRIAFQFNVHILANPLGCIDLIGDHGNTTLDGFHN